MWESIMAWDGWQGAGVGLAWAVAVCLMLAGLAGCVIPILPGHLVILVGAIAFRLMLGAESGLRWWSFVVLVLLLAVSQTLETLSGAAGSKWFGGTKWGSIGALAGGIVGLFFMPFGLFLGPLIGAVTLELAFGRKEARPAVVSGVGSVVGTLAGMGIKIAIGALMIVWFFVDVLWIG